MFPEGSYHEPIVIWTCMFWGLVGHETHVFIHSQRSSCDIWWHPAASLQGKGCECVTGSAPRINKKVLEVRVPVTWVTSVASP